MPSLDLRLFGSPLLSIDQRPITLAPRQPLALLVYLALAESAVSRDRLAFLLWPDQSTKCGAQSPTYDTLSIAQRDQHSFARHRMSLSPWRSFYC